MANFPREVEKKIAKDSGQFLKAEFEKTVIKNFETIKNQMIKEFLNHPVTKEILAGPAAENISETLGGNGNLFSYIGFEEGSEPIEKVLEEFRKTSIRFNGLIENGANWLIFMPAKEDIWEASPMPWAPVDLGLKVLKLVFLEWGNIYTIFVENCQHLAQEQVYKRKQN